MRFSVITLFLLLLAASCRPVVEDSIHTSSRRYFIPADGGTDSTKVTASGAWHVSSNALWVAVKMVGDSMARFDVEFNDTKEARSATLSFTCGTAVERVVIEQLATPGGLSKRALDSTALVALYKACDGENWYIGHDSIPHAWSLDMPITKWEGVTLTTVHGQLRVQSITLSGVGVKGVLPAELINLTELELLIMRQNQIQGPALSLLSRLPRLIYIDLSRNFFLDIAKSEIAADGFPKLEHLLLENTQFNSPLPHWATKSGLVEISLSGCGITGDIPAQLQQLTGLRRLNLAQNEIAGTIPEWIGLLTQLSELDLSLCKLTGEIPATIGSLRNLRTLKLACNSLTGEIPASIGSIQNLEILNLSENKLSRLPVEITSCRLLTHLDASFNNIEGQLWEQWGLIPSLTTLTLVGNRMSGEIPQTLLDDKRWRNDWFALSLICPQQEGYGFSNTPSK